MVLTNGGKSDSSRYPNYFGDITLWTGIATMAVGVLVRAPIQAALGWTGITGFVSAVVSAYISPGFVAYALLRISGVPLSEKKYDKLFGDAKDYRNWRYNTPMLWPRLF
jgi:steroid 5-alpha reductase family enzyme